MVSAFKRKFLDRFQHALAAECDDLHGVIPDGINADIPASLEIRGFFGELFVAISSLSALFGDQFTQPGGDRLSHRYLPMADGRQEPRHHSRKDRDAGEDTAPGHP